MKLPWPKLALGLALAIGLLAALARFGDFDPSALRELSPTYFVLTILTSVIVVLLRSANHRLLSSSGLEWPLNSWFQLGARHQAIFSLVPSGLGDLGFPYLGKRYVGLSTIEAARIIFLARVRDALILVALGSAGVFVLDEWVPVSGALAIGSLSAACQLEVLLARSTRLVETLASRPDGLFATVRSMGDFTHAGDRIRRTLVSLTIWLTATAALWLAFKAGGTDLAIAEAMVLIAAINFAGLIALTVGGLGVSEAVSVGVLVWIGWTVQDATQASLIGRPIQFLCTLSACALIVAVLKIASRSTQRQA